MAFYNSLSTLEGGYYERLIGVLKQTIKRAIERKILNLEQYQTLITEAEAVANTRPLTYIYPDVSSSKLRPIDFQLPNKKFSYRHILQTKVMIRYIFQLKNAIN